MSYFKLIPSKSAKAYKNLTKNLNISDQFKKINDLYQDFLTFYDKKYKFVKEYGFENLKAEQKFKGLEKLDKSIKIVLSVLKFCSSNNVSLNSYFKHNSSKISRRCFYLHKKKFCNMCDHYIQNYYLHIWKSKRNKTIKYVYDESIRFKICNYYFETIENEFEYFNKTNIWLKIRKENILNLNDKLNNLSYKTFIKILKNDPRWGSIPLKKHKNTHIFRKWIIPIGKIQLDLKVTNNKDTKMNKHIYIFNMIDTSTRVTFSKVLYKADKFHVMEALNEGYLFFQKHGINIINIQTDNAMMFKGTNFIRDLDFSKWCIDHNISRSLIPLMEPEANGCIERFHRSMDNEFIVKIKNYDNLDNIQEELERFSYYYNEQRYLHYGELNKIDPKNRYMKPIDSIKYFKSCTI